MADGRVLHAETGEHVHILRYEGDIRYPLAPSISRFFTDLLANSTIAGLVIDLTATQHIDSTNLGQIARFAQRVQTSGRGRATIVSSREHITEILISMGLDEVFAIIGDPPDTEAAEPIPAELASPAVTLCNMLEAHKALMELHEKNQDKFRDVVAMLEAEAANLPDDD